MKFSFKFSNLLGTVYRKGNVVFSPDGNTLLSPVGSRLSAFDLKNNKSETLPIESKYNFTTVGLSPNGNLMVLVNEEGEGYLCSLINKSVISLYNFGRSVHAVQFSPDGSKFAVTKENKVLLFESPGCGKTFNPFVLLRTFYGPYDATTSIDWTSDSKAICVGCKDMNTHVYGAEKFENLIVYSLGGHRDAIIGSFFMKNSLDLISVSHDSWVSVWKCDTVLSGLIPATAKPSQEDTDELSSSDDDLTDSKKVNKIKYVKVMGHTFSEVEAKRKDGANPTYVFASACSFHKQLGILVTAFTDGTFHLHEMPDFTHIQSLSLGEQSIDSVAFNSTGDWLALACTSSGQLVVWEWQSETYIMKQQGHFNAMSCVAHSPDGQYIATGGDDSKLKVWNTDNGFCFVTFSEHTGGITGVVFTQNGKVLISSSLDGTVRAFDLHRYRNFRTFTSTRQVQFGCLAVDSSGEIVCAGGRDVFDIFVWSMQTGRLLEILAGHDAPVSSIAFSPVSAVLISVSWDKTVKIWDTFERKSARESILLNSDGMAVAFRPDGKEFAVTTLRGHILFFELETTNQSGAIEARGDIGYIRKRSEKVTAKKGSASSTFTCLCYSADGLSVIAGGQSPYVCIYSVSDQTLLKKFKITQNLSMDGTQEFLDRRRMTEVGSVDEFETREEKEAGLPGVRKGDMSLRRERPELRVSSLSFSPTGRSWAATSTEGVLIYSLDSSISFDPFEFGIDVRPDMLHEALKRQEYGLAILLALRLNVSELVRIALEGTPLSQAAVVIQSFPDRYVDKLLERLAPLLESSAHVQFYVHWSLQLLTIHGPALKRRGRHVSAACTALLKTLALRHDQLRKICDYNKYTMSYLLAAQKCKRKGASEGMAVSLS